MRKGHRYIIWCHDKTVQAFHRKLYTCTCTVMTFMLLLCFSALKMTCYRCLKVFTKFCLSDENEEPFTIPGPAISEPDLYMRTLTDRDMSENPAEVTKLQSAFSINQRIQAAVIETECIRNRMPTSASNRLRLLNTFKRPRSVDSYLSPPPQNEGHLDQSIQITNLPNVHHTHKTHRKKNGPLQR